jgi:flagellar basal body P-ring formation protein FlgA
MFTRLLILLFLIFATSQCDTLKQTYTFNEAKIYSSDLVNGCPKRFEILQIPEGKNTYRINAQIIAKAYELNGCNIDITKVRYVNFTKQTTLNLSPLKKQLYDSFMTNYPTMIIQKIDIFPRAFVESLPEYFTAVFDKDICDNNNGTFYVIDGNGIRRYFDFTLEATLNVLHSNNKITRNTIISSSNTAIKLVPFTQFRGKPLSALPNQAQRFRRSIRENEPIVDRYLEPLPIVLKGAKVSAQVQNGLVIVEFIATATQEGALYDIITIEKSDNKRAKAKVIGENRVELQ